MDEKEERRTYSTWTASEETTREFMFQYNSCTRALNLCRLDQRYLITAYDHLHAVVRILLGYCEKTLQDDLKKTDEDLFKKMNEYHLGDEFYRSDNFTQYFTEIDKFFSVISIQAVNKKLFPARGSDRTMDEIREAIKQH